MKKLVIKGAPEMSLDEQRTRLSINRVIERVKNTNELRSWLLDQVYGVEKDGFELTPAWLSYEKAVAYYKEATA